MRYVLSQVGYFFFNGFPANQLPIALNQTFVFRNGAPSFLRNKQPHFLAGNVCSKKISLSKDKARVQILHADFSLYMNFCYSLEILFNLYAVAVNNAPKHIVLKFELK